MDYVQRDASHERGATERSVGDVDKSGSPAPPPKTFKSVPCAVDRTAMSKPDRPIDTSYGTFVEELTSFQKQLPFSWSAGENQGHHRAARSPRCAPFTLRNLVDCTSNIAIDSTSTE
jgi:hypothetical protein